MTFEVGASVVYPAHGIAEIVGREERVVGGSSASYLLLTVQQRGWGSSGELRISLPESRAEDLGVRAVVSGAEAAEILDVLAVTDPRVPSNWSRRLKNHQEKLKSGDVYQCAEVVRNLSVRKRTSSLSNIERSMYANARYLLIGELAVSWDVDVDDAEARVDEVLAGASAPATGPTRGAAGAGG